MNDISAAIMPSAEMVDFLHSLKFETLPAGVAAAARTRLLDGLGCGLYGAVMPWGKISAQVVYDEESKGKATVYGNAKPVAPARAALVNGTATHGIELDDIVPGAHVHPGAVVIPAVLATAEQYEVSGARLILGLIAGYEAMGRTGRAIGEAGWGFHITGIAGPIGAAVASGVALGMSQEEILRAIGIACSNAAGIKSFTQGSGGMIKRMHAGRAAESGVLACALARKGFTAPLAALDGKFGLLETYGGDKSNAKLLSKGLGEKFLVSGVWTKVFPCCGVLHTTAQALHALKVQNNIDVKDIKSVRVGTNQRAIALNGNPLPKDTMAAQYSLPYTAAVALTHDPRDPRHYGEDRLGDAEVSALACRVELYNDQEMEAMYPRYGTVAQVTLNDGRKIDTKLLDAHGTPADPCTEDEAKEKFRMLGSVTNSAESIQQVLDLVGKLDTLATVAPLSAALRSGIKS
jgi:2-methylcitrate dehydratase PrpD